MSSDTAVAANGTERPEPPHAAGEGEEWAAVEENPREWFPSGEGKTCRSRTGGARRACGAPAEVATLHGIVRPVAWNHCRPHAYGRWTERNADGKLVVMRWQLRNAKTGEPVG